MKKAEAEKTVTIEQLKIVKGGKERQRSVTSELYVYKCEELMGLAKADISINSFS